MPKYEVLVTKALATAVFDVLVAEAGARDIEWAREDFVSAFTRGGCRSKEFRFMGSLGFGGKVKFDCWRDVPIFVDYYPEDCAPEHDAAVLRTNKKLAALWEASKLWRVAQAEERRVLRRRKTHRRRVRRGY